ncbi:hypothetical protein [Bifidobacterium pseudolongum]|nr:hypothetical protein [Bifidobacterium pseudolongum]
MMIAAGSAYRELMRFGVSSHLLYVALLGQGHGCESAHRCWYQAVIDGMN